MFQEFLSGGTGSGKIPLTKFFFFFFFSPQLILQKSNGYFQRQRKLSFSKVPEGVQHFPARVQLFPVGAGWRGSNSLFPLTCDFPGRCGPPVSPSGSTHEVCRFKPCRGTCIVSLSKTFYPQLRICSSQEDLSRHY